MATQLKQKHHTNKWGPEQWCLAGLVFPPMVFEQKSVETTSMESQSTYYKKNYFRVKQVHISCTKEKTRAGHDSQQIQLPILCIECWLLLLFHWDENIFVIIFRYSVKSVQWSYKLKGTSDECTMQTTLVKHYSMRLNISACISQWWVLLRSLLNIGQLESTEST